MTASDFFDMTRAISMLEADSVRERAAEYALRFPGTFIVAVGGFPIRVTDGGAMEWAGGPTDRIATEIRRGLGLSGMLTYMNRSRLSLEELGDLCLRLEHNWAFRWMTLSLVFSGFSHSAELAFARDTRFYLSWPVGPGSPTMPVFVANGSLHSWVRFARHYDDTDFDPDTRKAMLAANRILQRLMGERR